VTRDHGEPGGDDRDAPPSSHATGEPMPSSSNAVAGDRVWTAATVVVGAAAAVAAWVASLFYVPLAPVLLSATFAAACLIAMAAAPKLWIRALWFNVAFVILAVGTFDAWVGHRATTTEQQQTFSDATGLFVVDDTLGVRPNPGVRSTARATWHGEQIYDVVYTVDDSGLRVSPPAATNAPQDCVLFFGGSFTFGEGLEDDETMPYRVGVRAGGRFRVRNFGFSGYGPHQMLAAIQSGFVEHAAHCRPRFAIYQAVYHHVVRSAGLWTWDRHGPRYLLGEDGRPIRSGNFDSEHDPTRPLRALEKSGVATALRRRAMDVGPGDATEDDVALFRAIVEESRRLLVEKWPDLEFHVIYWDVYDNQGRWPLFDDDPRMAGIAIHPISQILPPVDDPQGVYKFVHDVHPTARADDLIAAYVVGHILHVD